MALIPTGQVPDDYRRKLAYKLMMEGTDASPVQHWAQGLARMGQGALGGYEMYQADQKDKETEAGNNTALIAALERFGGGAPSTPAQPQPTPQQPTAQPPAPVSSVTPSAGAVPAALSGARPGGPVMPSNKVWGDAEAEAAGIYEKPAAGPKIAANGPVALPPQPAAQPAPMVPTPVKTEAIAPAASAPDPQKQAAKARLAEMLRSDNPQVRNVGRGLAQKFIESEFSAEATPKYDFKTAGDSLYRTNSKTGVAEPIKDVGRGVRPMTEDERRQWKVPEGVAAGVDDNGKPSFSQPSTVNTVSPVVTGINDRFDKQLQGAQAAHSVVSSVHEARRALDGGAITGFGADNRLIASKIGTLFGMPNESVTNTEKLGAALGNHVLESAKTLGANPSNADREYIEKVKGSKSLDESSIRALLDMQERWAREGVKRSNEMAKKLVQTDPEKLGRFSPMLNVDDPPSYDDYIKATPGKTSATPAASKPTSPAIAPGAIEEARRRGLIK